MRVSQMVQKERVMSNGEPTQEEIREAIEYLRGQRDNPTSELELARNEQKRLGNFAGCLGMIVAFFMLGAVGALAAGHIGSGLILLGTFGGVGYFWWHIRKVALEKVQDVERLKKEKVMSGTSHDNLSSLS